MISSLRYKSYQSYINSNDFVETLTLPGIKHILGLVWEAYDYSRAVYKNSTFVA